MTTTSTRKVDTMNLCSATRAMPRHPRAPTSSARGPPPLPRDQSRRRAPGSTGVVARAVARAKQGDREALRFLYLQLRRQRLRLRPQHRARRPRGRGRHAARVREAHDGRCRSTSSATVPFAAWLLRLSHNVALDHLRRAARSPVDEVREPRRRASTRARRSDTALVAARGARRAARGSARGRRPPPRRRPDARARSPERLGQDRALDPRPAPPRPRRPARRAHRA